MSPGAHRPKTTRTYSPGRSGASTVRPDGRRSGAMKPSKTLCQTRAPALTSDRAPATSYQLAESSSGGPASKSSVSAWPEATARGSTFVTGPMKSTQRPAPWNVQQWVPGPPSSAPAAPASSVAEGRSPVGAAPRGGDEGGVAVGERSVAPGASLQAETNSINTRTTPTIFMNIQTKPAPERFTKRRLRLLRA